MKINLNHYLTNHTIFESLSNKKIAENRNKIIQQSHLAKIAYGVTSVIKELPKTFAVLFLTNKIASCIFCTTNISYDFHHNQQFSMVDVVIFAPITEEILFRGILQNSVNLVQNFAKTKLNVNKQSSRSAQWLVSPSCRILISNLIFSAIHLSNRGTFLSTAQAVTQCARIILMPTLSLIYEETSSINASIVGHMTNNLIPYALYALSKKA